MREAESWALPKNQTKPSQRRSHIQGRCHRGPGRHLRGFDDEALWLREAPQSLDSFDVEDYDFNDGEGDFATEDAPYKVKPKKQILIPDFSHIPRWGQSSPSGSYIISRCQSEDVHWYNIAKIRHQNINTARKNGLSIRSAIEHFDAAIVFIVLRIACAVAAI